MRSLRRGWRPSWMSSWRSAPSSLLSSWTVLTRSFGSSYGKRLKMLGVLAGLDQSGSGMCLAWYASVL